MGYQHCDEHNEDATNGCASCWRKSVMDTPPMTSGDEEQLRAWALDVNHLDYTGVKWMRTVDGLRDRLAAVTAKLPGLKLGHHMDPEGCECPTLNGNEECPDWCGVLEHNARVDEVHAIATGVRCPHCGFESDDKSAYDPGFPCPRCKKGGPQTTRSTRELNERIERRVSGVACPCGGYRVEKS